MDKKEILGSISYKGNGEIYLGVVGAVRTGKSTFIKRFIENLVIPNIEDEITRKRCLDEIPQSASGKTIMTIEPKFVPSSGATIKIDDFETNIKLVDCVGYVINGSIGFEDNEGNPRMIKTPWYDEELPFVQAASIGTEKVIKDHSTIGILVTTDGSIGEIPRGNYKETEENIVNELKGLNKPFIVILNTTHPRNPETISLANSLCEKYDVPVIPISVETMNEEEVLHILKTALYEFPIENIEINMPDWIAVLDKNHPLKNKYLNAIKTCVTDINKLRDVDNINMNFKECEEITEAYVSNVNTDTSVVTITLDSPDSLYNDILRDAIGVNINSKAELLKIFEDFKNGKSEYEGVKNALKEVAATGYGIVTPKLEDMSLSTPEVIKQGSRYGVKLKATAYSIHMIKVPVDSTFEPIIGSELQSKELIDHLMKDREDKNSIWKSEIFGRSLDVIVQEGIQAKLSLLPENTRYKLSQTLTKMVNKGSSNLIAIVL